MFFKKNFFFEKETTKKNCLEIFSKIHQEKSLCLKYLLTNQDLCNETLGMGYVSGTCLEEKCLEKIFDAIMKNTFLTDCYNITRKRNLKCLQPASIEIESLTLLEVNNTLE